MQVIACSDGTSLRFPDKAMYKRYKAEELQLTLKYYAEIRAKYGVWAGNQGKFVATREELNDLDGTKMEDLLAAQPVASEPVAEWQGRVGKRGQWKRIDPPPGETIEQRLEYIRSMPAYEVRPLYAAPQPAPDRVPLTKDQVLAILDKVAPTGILSGYMKFASAVEAAHHITTKG